MPKALRNAAHIRATESEVQAMVEAHLAQVRMVAWRMLRGRGSRELVEDAIQEGAIGLIEAARRYDPERGIQFSTYAEHRIRGAILDGLRRLGRWRTDWEKIRESERATARQMGMSVGALREWEEELGDSPSKTTAGPPEVEDAAGPLEHLLAREASARLWGALAGLPERERRILARHYLGGVSLREAGRELTVSEARVSQLHRRALAKLRDSLRDERV
jgi:RNA polymerase sigma factor for flagellar operon FliA